MSSISPINRGVLAVDREYSLTQRIGNRRQVVFTGSGSDFRKEVFRIIRDKQRLIKYTRACDSFYEVVWAAPPNVDVVVAISDTIVDDKPAVLTGRWKRKDISMDTMTVDLE